MDDLNHIDLPASLVAELYPSSLIDSNDSPENFQPVSPGVSNTVAEPEWKWLGNNNQHILIIVNYPGMAYLPDRELGFLTGILGACKLSVGDVAIVNLYNYPDVFYKDLISFFKSRIVFLFEVEPSSFGLPISFPHFQLQSFANCSFLFSPSLLVLEEDKVLKSKLWVCLRRMFGL